MNRHSLQRIFVLTLSLALASGNTWAQDAAPAPLYSQPQLEQMLAPVALYPDPLLGQVLMAATYPLEIVEAARWAKDPNNAALTGDQLAAALEQQPWDPSVKSLVPFPQVLNMMNGNIQWTEQLGDAFLAQQAAVMDSVQQLRRQAQTAGALTSTPQEVVATQGSEIVIQPQDPSVIYVPVYNPTVVYGTWGYPAYPPYYFYPRDYVWSAGFIGFGVGIFVAEPFRGWNHWDWAHHQMYIDQARFSYINRGHPPFSSGGTWQHDPAHRQGVPYRGTWAREHFQNAGSAEAQHNLRGYAPAATPGNHSNYQPQSQQSNGHEFVHNAQPAAPHNTVNLPQAPHYAAAPARLPQHSVAPTPRPATPLFESFSHGSEVRAQSSRGAVSRSAVPAPTNTPRGNSGNTQNNNSTEHHW